MLKPIREIIPNFWVTYSAICATC